MNKKLLAILLFFVSLGLSAQAATLSLFADNKLQINPNTAVNVTSNISNQVWVINTVSDLYINTWGGTATAANSRKLLANSIYPVQMVSSKFSILGTATENIIITQVYPGVQNTIAIKKKISASEVSTALSGSPLGVGYGGTGTSTAFTSGSIPFAGASGIFSQNNSNFFWDNSNTRLGIGTATPAQTLDVAGIIKTSQQIRSASNRETLSGNKTLTATSPQYQFLNPNGANRDVTLPSATQEMFFVVKNIGTGGYKLTGKDSGGSAITGGTIANNVAMGFYYDGTAWQLL